MAKRCVNTDKKQVEKKVTDLKKNLQELGISFGDLSDAEINTALGNLVNEERLGSVEVLFEPRNIPIYSSKISEHIAAARNKAKEEQQELSKYKENLAKIGTATLVVKTDKDWTSDTPKENKDTLYIYPDNLQAFNELAEDNEKVKIDRLIEPKDGVKTNVKYTAAAVRTDSNGIKNENAIGIPTKLNAQDEEGKWIHNKREDAAEKGAFQGKEELEVYKEVVGKRLDKIARLLNISGEKDSSQRYNKVEIPQRMGLDTAGLPKDFADALSKLFEEKLGIRSQVLVSSLPGMYGLEIQSAPVQQISKKEEERKKKENAKREQIKKEIKESLEAERPIQDIPKPVEGNRLSDIFPNIAERKARISLISDMFSRLLTQFVLGKKATLNTIDDSRLSYEDAELKRVLNTESEEIQRRAILELKVGQTGVPIPKLIVQNIYNALREIVVNYDKAIAGDPTIMDNMIDNFILNPDHIFGFDFAIESRQNNWSGITERQEAYKRIAYLANAFRKMIDMNTFGLLLNAAKDEIEFYENVRFSAGFDRTMETTEDLENIDEEGSADTRSGLGIVKYKMMDPARTVSSRIKSLLGRQYKTEYTSDGGIRYAFSDLGMRVRMNSGVVYYKLLDTFCNMNSSEEFLRMLDSVEEKYPWFEGIRTILQNNEDLRNEFFRAFRKVFTKYAVISDTGRIYFKNTALSTEAFLEELIRNYEGMVVLGENSIYTSTGEYDAENTGKLRELLESPKKGQNKIKDEGYLKNHPLNWAMKVLYPRSKERDTKIHTVDNIRTAVALLRGELKGHKGISLEKVLNNIGIDTTNINLSALLPYISDRTWTMIEDPHIIKDDVWENMTEEEQRQEKEMVEYLQSKNTDMERLNVFLTDKQMFDITDILVSVQNIVHKETGFKTGDHLVQKNKSSYLRIANRLPMVSEGYSLSSFFFDGNSRYSYVSPDYISKLTGIISKVETDEEVDEGTKFIEENFGKYDFFKDPVTREWRSPALKELATSRVVRKNFSSINILSVGGSTKNDTIERVKDAQFARGLVAAFFCGNAENGIEFGYYRNPLFSDTDALVLFKMVKHTGKDFDKIIIEKLKDVFLQEYNRIVDSRNSKNTEVDFYNDKKYNNASKFCFFTAFRGKENDIIKDIKTIANETDANSFVEERDNYIRELLTEMMRYKVAAFKDSFSKSDKLGLYSSILKNKKEEETEDTSAESIFTIEEEEEKEEEEVPQKEQNQKIEQADRWLEEFYYNDYYTQSQLIQLLFGDLAYAKNIRDFIKRNKQCYVGGEKMFALDENGEPLMETAMYLEDRYEVANTWSSIKALLESSHLLQEDKGMILGALEKYAKICATDGQSFRSIHSFRKIFKAMGGKWTPAMENVYHRILSGNFGTEDFLTIWNPIKPFMFTFEEKTVNGRIEKIPVQHKNSEYLLSAMFSVLNTGLNKSPELVALNQFMEKHKIDVIHFHSVVKNGYNSPFNLEYNTDKFNQALIKNEGIFRVGNTIIEAQSYNDYKNAIKEKLLGGQISQQDYNTAIKRFAFSSPKVALKHLEDQLRNTEDGNINKGMLHQFPLEDLCIVQPTDDHLLDAEAVFGSQFRNIITADLPEDFTMSVKINGKDTVLNKEETVKFYDTLIVDQLGDSFTSVASKFKNIKILKRALDELTANNPRYGDDVKAALELNDQGTDFKMPFNSPNLTNKIDALLLSSFKNAIQRQKINGGNIILVSNFGRSKELQTKYINNDPTQGIEYVPAYMPAYMRYMFDDYIVEETEKRKDKDGNETGEKVTYWKIDFKKLEKNNEEDLLKILGYRIPTEDKYSILPIKIAGFLSINCGTSIMLPSEIITMSGTDFDIDKLFLMIRNSVREIAPASFGREFVKWANLNQERLVNNAIDTLFDTLFEEVEQEELYSQEELEEIQDKKEQRERDEWVIQQLQSRVKGFTANNLAKMVNESPLFAQFMAEHREDLNPKYKVRKAPTIYRKDADGKDTEELDLDAMSQLEDINSKKIKKMLRDNMLIDIAWGVLTSPEGARQCMTPASFDRVKHGSRQQRILDSKQALEEFYNKYEKRIENEGLYKVLDSMTADELEEFYNEYALGDDPLDFQFYIASHRNLMDGNALIGAFAVNSSSHFKFQFANLRINKDYQFNITTPETGTVHIDTIDKRLSPITGEAIGRICSEFQAASPDNGKDPTLGDLKASLATVFRINFLTRIGLKPEIIGYLNNAEDLRIEGKRLNRDKDNTKFEEWSGSIEKIVEMIAEVRMTGEVSPENREDAMAFADWMDNIDRIASDLNLSTCFSRCDSPNGALNPSTAEAIQQLLLTEDFMEHASSPAFSIKGLTDIVDLELDATVETDEDALRRKILDKPIPRLQAFYTYGIRSPFNLSAKYLPQMHPEVIDAIRILRSKTKDNITQALVRSSGTNVLKTFINELTMYMLSSDSIFATEADGKTIMEKRNFYINNFPMKFNQFLNEKDKNGKFKHPDIHSLTIMKMISNRSKKGIKFVNIGGKVSPESRKYFMEDLEYMLKHKDSEVNKFAIDMFMYAYYDNGINFGKSNYGILYSTAFLDAIPRYIDKLFMLNGKLKSGLIPLERYVDQWLLNHPENTIGINRHDFEWSSTEKGVIILKKMSPSKRGYSRGKDKVLYLDNNNVMHAVKYISFRNFLGKVSKVFALMTDEKGKFDIKNLKYKEVSWNKAMAVDRTPYYDANLEAEQIVWEELKPRGTVTKVSSAKISGSKSENNSKDISNAPKDEKEIKEAPEERDVKNIPNDNDEDINDSTVPNDNDDILNNEIPNEGDPITDRDMEHLFAMNRFEELQKAKESEITGFSEEEDNLNVPKDEKKLEDFKPLEDPENTIC